VTAGRMHRDEVETDEAVVRRLLEEQFPQWARLPIERVPSSGTDNALYRLGPDLVVRLPRIHWAAGAIDKELRWLPQLARRLPVSIPVVLAKGEPAESFPWTWGIYSWLEGENPRLDGAAGDGAAHARDLAAFVTAVQALDLADGPPARRGRPLREAQDEPVRAALAELRPLGLIDVDAAEAAWDEALAALPWTGSPVWVHGDLLAGNVLLCDDRVSGVIDWSGVGIGDPACDLMVAWNLLSPDGRELFRRAVRADEAMWARGRGWALSVSLVQLPYYRETNPGLAANALHVIGQVLTGDRGRA
jgi:aminoglycoside phosphotransferase (APT) family kinase protein